jgi:uncharacterized membrane protein YqjE
MAAEYLSGRNPSDQEPASSLFSRLLGDASALVRNEIALAKSELHAAATNAKLGLAALAIASVVMLAGMMTLIAAIVLALAQVMQPWTAALIVGAVLSGIGIAMFVTAKRKLSTTKHPLQRTRTSLQQDAAMIARRT